MIRKLAPYTRGYRIWIVLGVLCSAGEAVLELLLPMEKWKREQLIPVLEQLREYLAELLMLRSGLGTPDDTQKKILQGRTGAELLAAANNLQTAIDDLNANVGAGAVIGWLSLQLR